MGLSSKFSLRKKIMFVTSKTPSADKNIKKKNQVRNGDS